MIGGRLRQAFHRVRGRLIEFDLTPYRRLLARIDVRGEGETRGKLGTHPSFPCGCQMKGSGFR